MCRIILITLLLFVFRGSFALAHCSKVFEETANGVYYFGPNGSVRFLPDDRRESANFVSFGPTGRDWLRPESAQAKPVVELPLSHASHRQILIQLLGKDAVEQALGTSSPEDSLIKALDSLPAKKKTNIGRNKIDSKVREAIDFFLNNQRYEGSLLTPEDTLTESELDQLLTKILENDYVFSLDDALKIVTKKWTAASAARLKNFVEVRLYIPYQNTDGHLFEFVLDVFYPGIMAHPYIRHTIEEWIAEITNNRIVTDLPQEEYVTFSVIKRAKSKWILISEENHPGRRENLFKWNQIEESQITKKVSLLNLR